MDFIGVLASARTGGAAEIIMRPTKNTPRPMRRM